MKICIASIVFISFIACLPAQEKVIKRERDGAEMRLVPSGNFIRGSYNLVNECPPRVIYLDAFYMDTYNVTVGQYKKFLKATGHSPPPAKFWKEFKYHKDNYPVVGVTTADAEAYCKWVGARLPTEAEWEKAARGTDGRIYPWGNRWNKYYLNHGLGHVPWHDGSDGYEMLSPVGVFPKSISPYGLHDMCGNVWEWVADRFSLTYYYTCSDKNPVPNQEVFKGPLIHPGRTFDHYRDPKKGILRSIRGGGYGDGPAFQRIGNRDHLDVNGKKIPSLDACTTTIRTGFHENSQKPYIGFRCVRSVVAK